MGPPLRGPGAMPSNDKVAMFMGFWLALLQFRAAEHRLLGHAPHTPSPASPRGPRRSKSSATVNVEPAQQLAPSFSLSTFLRVFKRVAYILIVLWGFMELCEYRARPLGQPALAKRRPRPSTAYGNNTAAAAGADGLAEVEPGTPHTRIAIVGGGPAGLSMAMQLDRAGVKGYRVFDAGAPGQSWANRYDRLHLHTLNSISSLPGVPFPAHWPEYVHKDQLARYYRAAAELLPPGAYLSHHRVASATFSPRARPPASEAAAPAAPAPASRRSSSAAWTAASPSRTTSSSSTMATRPGASSAPAWSAASFPSSAASSAPAATRGPSCCHGPIISGFIRW
mmetsp:Transcript_41789/g.130887  ORF Transcript_41789/g.130887 Transcript_41789/m.130887 type:complete len:338 (-) Transcript_41789:915-1928(-)